MPDAFTQLRLRPDAVWRREEFRNTPCWILQDPRSGRFFRMGTREHLFLVGLDGKTAPSGLLTPEAGGTEQNLGETEARRLLAPLTQIGLVELPPGARRDPALAPPPPSGFNIFFIRTPLGNPDKLFGHIEERTRWLFTPLVGWAVGALVVAALFVLATESDRFSAALGGLLHPYNWWGLAISWIALKIIHETAHGVVCKRYGGTVPEVGVTWILFAPLGYVDTTSSWGFPSKWQRIAVVAAGMALEMICGCLALLVWAYTEPGWAHYLAFNTATTATVITLLCNANPLMRFDGYFILSDWLEIPNLARRGREALLDAISAPLLERRTKAHTPGIHAWGGALLAFGAAQWLWQMGLALGLIVAASVLLQGAGIVIALSGIVLWFGQPLFRSLASWRALPAAPRNRIALRVALTLVSLALMGLLPFPARIQAPGIIELQDMHLLRARAPGFVEAVHATSGQQVVPGQPLVTLSNPDAPLRLKRCELEARRYDLRARQSLQKGDVAGYQQNQKLWEASEARWREQQTWTQSLSVCAPVAGTVVAPPMQDWQGRFFGEGEPLLAVAPTHAREVRAAISVQDADLFRTRLGGPIAVIVPGRFGSFSGTLLRMEQEARKELPHPALGAQAGGPLPVAPTQRNRSGSVPYDLIEPRFGAAVEIISPTGVSLLAGERAFIYFWTVQSLWTHTQQWTEHWLERLWNRAQPTLP